MIADLFGDDMTSCLWCVFSGNTRTVKDPFRERTRKLQGKRSDVKDRAIAGKAFPYLVVKWIYGGGVYDDIYLMYAMVPVTQLLFGNSLKMPGLGSFHGGGICIVNVNIVCKKLKDVSNLFSAVPIACQQYPAVADLKSGF